MDETPALGEGRQVWPRVFYTDAPPTPIRSQKQSGWFLKHLGIDMEFTESSLRPGSLYFKPHVEVSSRQMQASSLENLSN